MAKRTPVGRLVGWQSSLSASSALFYAAGGILSILAATIFRDASATVGPLRFVTAALSLALAIVFAAWGRRTNRTLALGLMAVTALFVLALSFTAPSEVRAMHAGLLFYTILIYLVWFGPMWFARVVGYAWLVAYCTLMMLRFGGESALFLLTLILTSILLGELVGSYKNRLEGFTLTDPLCKVWNKRAFEASLTKNAAAAQRSGQPLSLMYLDLDDFKRVNDTLGHVEGDRILSDFARTVDSHTRSQDTFARIGGDEFAMVMRDTTLAQAELVGRRLHALVTEVKWSFGVAQLQPGESVEDFTARADALMFAAKRERRARDGGGR